MEKKEPDGGTQTRNEHFPPGVQEFFGYVPARISIMLHRITSVRMMLHPIFHSHSQKLNATDKESHTKILLN